MQTINKAQRQLNLAFFLMLHLLLGPFQARRLQPGLCALRAPTTGLIQPGWAAGAKRRAACWDCLFSSSTLYWRLQQAEETLPSTPPAPASNPQPYPDASAPRRSSQLD